MESQPQNLEFMNNPENFHPSISKLCYNGTILQSMVIFQAFPCKIPWEKHLLAMP